MFETACSDEPDLARASSRFTGTTPGHWRRATRD